MAARGEAYIIMLSPEHKNPVAFIRVCPSNDSRVTRIAVVTKPMFNIATRIAVLC